MCLAVPVKISEVLPNGNVSVSSGETKLNMEVSTILLPEQPKVGDYVIVHAGFALRTLDPQEALESLNVFKEIAALGSA